MCVLCLSVCEMVTFLWLQIFVFQGYVMAALGSSAVLGFTSSVSAGLTASPLLETMSMFLKYLIILHHPQKYFNQ